MKKPKMNRNKTRFRISLKMYVFALIKSIVSASKHKTFGTIEKLRRIL